MSRRMLAAINALADAGTPLLGIVLNPGIGPCYTLPDGWTWIDVAAARERNPRLEGLAPLAIGPGVVAWGVPLPDARTGMYR